MFSTNTDMGRYLAAMVTRPSAIVIANTPTTMGTIAATSAPNATMSTTSVRGRRGVAESREERVGRAHGAVEDAGDVMGGGAGEGLLAAVGRAGRLAGCVAPARRCRGLRYTAGSRRGGQRRRCPRRDAPSG